MELSFHFNNVIWSSVFTLCISFSYAFSDFVVCGVRLISNLLAKNMIKQVACNSNYTL